MAMAGLVVANGELHLSVTFSAQVFLSVSFFYLCPVPR